MDTRLEGNAATELIGTIALADSEERAALVRVLENFAPRRAVSLKTYLRVVGALIAGVGVGLALSGARQAEADVILRNVLIGIGAVCGWTALLITVRTQRTLAAVILLMQRQSLQG